ncbi:hypothetical protein HK405_009530, partial [Cladochytrium tenue]
MRRIRRAKAAAGLLLALWPRGNSAQTTSTTSASSTAVTITACGPAAVDDFGVLTFNSSILLATAGSYAATSITYEATNSPDGSISPQTFTQDDVNNGLVTYTPAVGLTTLGATKSSSATFAVFVDSGNLATCTAAITISYHYAPSLDSSATYAISTSQYQPVLLTTSIVNFAEQHGLSTWYMNWSSTSTTFNAGTKGRIEYYSSSTGWTTLPLTQPFPHEWIVLGAVRYNPVNFNGTVALVLKLVNSLGIYITNSPIVANISITVATSSSKTVGSTAVSAYANLQCGDTYPSSFTPSFSSPIGAYCANFSAAASSTTTFTTPFLGSTLSVTTTGSTAATVYFGFAINPPSSLLPSGYTTVTFAGYMDYGAFSISVSPASAFSSAVFVTPEMTYDEALQITSSAAVAVVKFNASTSTTSVSYPSSVSTTAPPHMTINIYDTGYYAICQGNSSSSTTSTASVSYGSVVFVGTWGSKTYTFPTSSGVGQMQLTVNGSTDYTFSVVHSVATVWSPAASYRFDYFTISILSSSSSSATCNMSMAYTISSTALTNQGISISKVAWGRFVSALDGGSWNFDQVTSVDSTNQLLTVNFNSSLIGQWGLFSRPSGARARRRESLIPLPACTAIVTVIIVALHI